MHSHDIQPDEDIFLYAADPANSPEPWATLSDTEADLNLLLERIPAQCPSSPQAKFDRQQPFVIEQKGMKFASLSLCS